MEVSDRREASESGVVVVGSVVLVSSSGAVVEVVVVVLDVVVGGSVLVVVLALEVVRRGRGLVEGAGSAVVVVARRLVAGATGAGARARVVVGMVTVAWEVCWRGRTVVVVPCGNAPASCLGVVRNPTRLPPIAPSSTAAITLAHRRAATKRTGLTPESHPPGPVGASWTPGYAGGRRFA